MRDYIEIKILNINIALNFEVYFNYYFNYYYDR